MYSLMPLLSLERLLVSPVMMETISASEAPSAKAFVSFLTAFISGGNR